MVGEHIDWWIDGGYRRHPARPGCSTPGRCAALSPERIRLWGCLCQQAAREAAEQQRARP